MVQIRNVPAETHRRLKAKAAMAGMTLSDYLLQEVEQIAAMPTYEEMEARLRLSGGTVLSVSSVEAVRAERDGR